MPIFGAACWYSAWFYFNISHQRWNSNREYTNAIWIDSFVIIFYVFLQQLLFNSRHNFIMPILLTKNMFINLLHRLLKSSCSFYFTYFYFFFFISICIEEIHKCWQQHKMNLSKRPKRRYTVYLKRHHRMESRLHRLFVTCLNVKSYGIIGKMMGAKVNRKNTAQKLFTSAEKSLLLLFFFFKFEFNLKSLNVPSRQRMTNQKCRLKGSVVI